MRLADLELRDQHPELATTILRDAVKVKPETFAVYYLARLLIDQGKADEAEEYVAILRSRGLSQTIVRVLDAQKLMVNKKWPEAIKEIEGVKPLYKSVTGMRAQLDLMLAECHSRMGSEEQRVAALQQAVDEGASSESARLELARALIRSEEYDEALRYLEPMADQRPELQIDVTEVRLQRTLRQPKNARQWSQVEDSLRRAEKSLGQRPEYDQKLTLLRANLYAARGDLDRAQEVVRARLKDSKDLTYRLALANFTLRKDPNGSSALKILDDAEKELGASVPINIARLTYWSLRGGAKAKAEVAKLAEFRKAPKPEEQRVYLFQAGLAMRRLNEPGEARNYWVELAKLTPNSVPLLRELLDLAIEGGDQSEAETLLARIKQSEGEEGTLWRYARANYLIDRHRRGVAKGPGGSRTDLEEARGLVEQIAERRKEWWGSYVLEAQIAELKPDVDVAIEGYKKALERGNTNPEVVKRLLALLNQQNRYDEIYRLAEDLRNRPDAPPELKLATAYKAILDHDYRGAIELAREIFPEQSLRYSDHLAMGRLYVAIPGKLEDAGKEFRRAVELGAGAPDSWLLYVQFLVQTRKLEEAKLAVQAAERALAGKGSNVILAECCMMVGENREAEALIQGSFKERPDDPQTLRVAAGFYLAMGKTDEVGKYLDLLMAPAPGATPEDLLWASRTRAKALLRTGQAADRDRALALVEDNLKGKSDSTASLEDQTLKARIMATRAKTTEDAIKILKPLDDAGRLGPDEQFLLAQLYLNGRNDKDFQDVMLKILVPNKTQAPNPHHISTYINFLISRGELVQADRWLADLKKIEPKGLATLEQQASLIKARNPGRPDPPGIRDMLEAYGKENPDQIYGVAILLNRYGFFKEAEQAYRAYIERDRGKPERELALAGFLASRRDEVRTSDAMAILTRAWKTCAPEQVAFTAPGSL